ncbi:outer membrane lipoprotein carrier protein LolA [Pseudaminobacter sp. 19-2017]|uniref:Outer membrane lipoprotein carrier protein LolA n=1 Tax=Pseudaminobacter soli (ex Zhang et al. 2022) TaxID=2831468 RepID=A0A942DYI1_9HYPH|nr:outer membrane lipoprotein carrier protein LolA [Pseudaminobacter soli]MBS3647711.1 outer membrane lipoprotein carrier protein LolA [Pseudaminobacter soli]
MTNRASNGFTMTRRRFASIAVAATLALTGAAPSIAAPGSMETAQKIANHFASIRTMSGEFVQFDARGRQTGGKFYIQRPGKIRFNYDGKSGFRVISDGDSVILENQRMKTMDLYPLSKTPLKLLLAERIDLSGNRVRSVKEEADQTVIQLVDKSAFGDAQITMVFDPSTYELRQWTIRDAQGKDTTVMVFNVQKDVALDQSLFKIDYKKNIELNKKNRNR